MDTVQEVERDRKIASSERPSTFYDSTRRSSVGPSQSQARLPTVSQAQTGGKDTIGNTTAKVPSKSYGYSKTTDSRYRYPSSGDMNRDESISSDSSEDSGSDTESATQTTETNISSMPAADFHELRTGSVNGRQWLSSLPSSYHPETDTRRRDESPQYSRRSSNEFSDTLSSRTINDDNTSRSSHTIENSSDTDTFGRKSYTIDDFGHSLRGNDLLSLAWDVLTGRTGRVTITLNNGDQSKWRDTSPGYSLNISVNYPKSTRHGGTTDRDSRGRGSWG